MMDEETWLTSDEALEMGFATKVVEDEPKQSINEMYLNHQVMENKRLAKQVKELNEKIKDLQLDPWSKFFK